VASAEQWRVSGPGSPGKSVAQAFSPDRSSSPAAAESPRALLQGQLRLIDQQEGSPTSRSDPIARTVQCTPLREVRVPNANVCRQEPGGRARAAAAPDGLERYGRAGLGRAGRGRGPGVARARHHPLPERCGPVSPRARVLSRSASPRLPSCRGAEVPCGQGSRSHACGVPSVRGRGRAAGGAGRGPAAGGAGGGHRSGGWCLSSRLPFSSAIALLQKKHSSERICREVMWMKGGVKRRRGRTVGGESTRRGAGGGRRRRELPAVADGRGLATRRHRRVVLPAPGP
jgi:hypothetical protein